MTAQGIPTRGQRGVTMRPFTTGGLDGPSSLSILLCAPARPEASSMEVNALFIIEV